MNYRILTSKELGEYAQRDARYGTDPLFTELVARALGLTRTLNGFGIHPVPTDGRAADVRP